VLKKGSVLFERSILEAEADVVAEQAKSFLRSRSVGRLPALLDQGKGLVVSSLLTQERDQGVSDRACLGSRVVQGGHQDFLGGGKLARLERKLGAVTGRLGGKSRVVGNPSPGLSRSAGTATGQLALTQAEENLRAIRPVLRQLPEPFPRLGIMAGAHLTSGSVEIGAQPALGPRALARIASQQNEDRT
jgi:hypothetical protein